MALYLALGRHEQKLARLKRPFAGCNDKTCLHIDGYTILVEINKTIVLDYILQKTGSMIAHLLGNVTRAYAFLLHVNACIHTTGTELNILVR